jgi:hypothetical protein
MTAELAELGAYGLPAGLAALYVGDPLGDTIG